MAEANSSSCEPALAITMGDPAGVGPEIIVKALASLQHKGNRPIVIGSHACLLQTAKQLNVRMNLTVVQSVSEAHSLCQSEETNLIPVIEPYLIHPDDFTMGTISADCGEASVKFFEYGVKEALAGNLRALVTCPINKEAIHLAGYVDDIGHQEILARMTGAQLTATMLMTPGLRVAHLSTHLSLGDAVRYVKRDIILKKLRLTADSLRQWGVVAPKIAVAALNPHAGEGGLLGREEQEEIAPAVAQARQEDMDVKGPIPADSVFNRAISGEFDVVLALYHDQGHIAIKVHNFSDSVTATMGIPFVRTSVDHGTAFDIAGKNVADESGLKAALHMASHLVAGKIEEI